MQVPMLHVGHGTTRGPLTVFPVWHSGPDHPTSVELAGRTNIRVTELPGAEVTALQVTVTGRKQVLLVDGDILTGGRQDRVVVGSFVLDPAASNTRVAVRCVEQHRWAGTGEHTVARRATSYVRQDRNQHAVWRRVADEGQILDAAPDVSDLTTLPGQSGVIIGIAGVPVLLEVFATPHMFTDAWPRLIEAASREAAGKQPQATGAESARSFVRGVGRITPAMDPTSGGYGRSIHGSAGPLELRGIITSAGLLHASVLSHSAH